MHHDPVALAEAVADVRQREVDRCRLVGHEGLGVLEGVAKLPTERLHAHELLVATHLEALRIGHQVGKVRGVDVDDDKVGVSATRRDLERGAERPDDRHVGLEHVGLVM